MAADSRAVLRRPQVRLSYLVVLASLLAVLTLSVTSPAQAAGGGAVAGGTVRDLVVTGQNGVPTDAKAVALNVTAVNPNGPGFVTIYPCGTAIPGTSSLNYAAGQTVPNAVIVRPGDGGKVCFYTPTTVDIIVDVQGYFTSASSIDLLPSLSRVLSTRDGVAAPKAKVKGGTVVELPLAAPRVPSSFDTSSAILNVTVTNPVGAGFLTVYTCGVPIPDASNLNFTAGQTVANLVIVRPGDSDRVCIFASETTDILADLSGWTGSDYSPIYGHVRNLNTRDGENAPKAKVLPGSITSLLVAFLAPNALNVTVTNPDSAGFVTVFPCGQPVPIASNLNFVAGQTVAGAVIVPPGGANEICFYSSATTDILVDSMGGWRTGYTALAAPVRALDTRDCSYAVYSEENKILERDRAVRTRVKNLATGTDRELYSLNNYGEPMIGHDCYIYVVADAVLSTPTPLDWTGQRTVERFSPDTGLAQTVYSEIVSSTNYTPLSLLSQDPSNFDLILARESATQSDLIRLTPQTGVVTPIGTVPGTAPAGTRDATKAYFLQAAGPTSTGGIYEFDVRSSVTRLRCRGASGVRPTVSPDGTKATMWISTTEQLLCNLISGEQYSNWGRIIGWSVDSLPLVLADDRVSVQVARPAGVETVLRSADPDAQQILSVLYGP
jgi:hypothetical protein